MVTLYRGDTLFFQSFYTHNNSANYIELPSSVDPTVDHDHGCKFSIFEHQERTLPPGGGYLGTESIPTAKRPPGAEAVNVKNWGRSTPFLAKVGAVKYKLRT